MSEVKRYAVWNCEHCHHDPTISEEAEGEYVGYDDYTRLEAERDELRLALESSERQVAERTEALAVAQDAQMRMRAERDQLRIAVELMLDVWAPGLAYDEPNCQCQGCDAVGKARAALAGKEKPE